MIKSKVKRIFITLITVIFVLGCLFAFLVYDKLIADKNYLTIQNGSSEAVTDVRIEYSNGNVTYIGTLDPSSEYKIKLTEVVNENSINLVYTDEKNNLHNVSLVSYLVLAENLNYYYKLK